MNVLLHADGGPGVGLGHATRCIALANALERRGHRAAIAVGQGELAGYVEQRGAKSILTDASIQGVRKAADSFAAEHLVIDNYKWSAHDFIAARGRWRIVAFDDEALRNLPVDAIVNGAPNARQLNYQKSSNTRLLLGLDYQVLREGMENIKGRCTANEVRQIIAMIGGDDQCDRLPTIADILENTVLNTKFPLKAEIIVGPFAKHPRPRCFHQVEFICNPPDLINRMVQADLAVSASGQTLYELARCGTPTIAFCNGPDQANNLESLAAEGVVLSAGEAGVCGWVERIRSSISFLLDNQDQRSAMSQRGQSLIDGCGADRLVSVLLSMTL